METRSPRSRLQGGESGDEACPSRPHEKREIRLRLDVGRDGDVSSDVHGRDRPCALGGAPTPRCQRTHANKRRGRRWHRGQRRRPFPGADGGVWGGAESDASVGHESGDACLRVPGAALCACLAASPCQNASRGRALNALFFNECATDLCCYSLPKPPRLLEEAYLWLTRNWSSGGGDMGPRVELLE